MDLAAIKHKKDSSMFLSMMFLYSRSHDEEYLKARRIAPSFVGPSTRIHSFAPAGWPCGKYTVNKLPSPRELSAVTDPPARRTIA
jgi:hypothetical protein